jgi:hypothetical protein
MKITKRSIPIELRFDGDGRIVEQPKGTFVGGVPDPTLTSQFGLNVLPEFTDGEGESGPVIGEGSYAGTLQINVWGTAADYRELGRHLLAIAELDTTVDPDFHQHYDELRSDDGQTRLHLILRKLPA